MDEYIKINYNTFIHIYKLEDNKYRIILDFESKLEIIVDNKYYLYKFLYYLSNINNYLYRRGYILLYSIYLGNLIYSVILYNRIIEGKYFSKLYLGIRNNKLNSICTINTYLIPKLRNSIKRYLNDKFMVTNN